MVIQDDAGAPVELPIIMLKPFGTDRGFSDLHNDLHQESTIESKKSRKHPKKSKKKSKNSSSVSDTEDGENIQTCEISAKDLKELRTVYKQCKAVIKKIESKYGHLLDLEVSESEIPPKKRSKLTSNDEDENQCQCALNKKIVFDEEGKEVPIDASPSNHICPSKLMSQSNYLPSSDNKNIQIEYFNNETELSDNLEELRDILQNPSIETTFRNQVINKLRMLKLEHSNEIKFNKHVIIEKLKTNPDEIFSFQGSNLSELPGYLF